MNFKTVVVPTLAFVVGSLISYAWLANQSESNTDESADNAPLYWVAPMDANYRRDEPGLSPMGMDLVPVFENEGASSGDNEPGTVSISSQVENSLGVKVSKVTRTDLHRNIQSAGFLQYDESSIQHYHVRVSGWLETLYVSSVGDRVSKGQKLFELYSPELVYAQEEYLAAILTNNTH